MTTCLLVFGLLVSAADPGPPQADTKPEEWAAHSTAGKFRLGLESSLMSVNLLSASFGVGQDLDIDQLSFGLSGGLLNLGGGLGDHFVIGSRLGIQYTNIIVNGAEGSATGVLVLPYAEYVFLSGSITPLLTVSAGFQGTFSEAVDIVGGTFSGGLGLRGFVTDAVSIELLVTAGYNIGSIDVSNGSSSVDASASGFSANALVGISIWL